MTLLAGNPAVRTRKRWTKQEYNDLVDRGALKGRIFLYRGEILEMPAMGALHCFGVSNITDWLSDTFRPEYRVRIQLPFECPDESEPEPDGAVVSHELIGYGTGTQGKNERGRSPQRRVGRNC